MDQRPPLLGDKFPQMSVKTTQGSKTLPDDYAGRWFVLFSHPADFTPVCTTEFVAFQQQVDRFEAVHCDLIGLSIDQVFSHIKWIDWIREHLEVDITFPVIADDQGHIAQRLGMISPAKGSNAVRAVFIVDPKGAVRASFHYPQELGRNMDELLRAVKGLQLADAHAVALPADWPHNSLIDDRVIVPPASDVETAQQRLQDYECYDWWFCHKKI